MCCGQMENKNWNLELTDWTDCVWQGVVSS